jgi:lipopolysaccharide heptosyltransferase II
MSVPAVRAIKNGRPDAHITIATPANLVPVWKLVPEVDEIIALKSKSLLGAVRQMERARKFDVGILFPNSLRVALEMWLSDVPRRVGYRGHSRAWLVNQIVRDRQKRGPLEHQSLRYLRIAHELGAATKALDLQETPNAQPPTPNAESSRLHQTSNTKHQTSLGLCAGAEYGPAKRWLPERFAEVASTIATEQSAKWVLLGTAKDADVGQQIAGALGDHCVNRIGQTSVEQLVEELRGCRLLLTNDTGTMHLAALLDIPVVAIFGSTEPALTAPIGNGHVILRDHVECSPCFLRECPIDFRCMKAVSVEEVRDAVLSILARSTSSPRLLSPRVAE